jgi:hypothetical protein
MKSINDNSPNSKPKQLVLLPLDQIPAYEAVKKRCFWYYLTRNLNAEMMVGFDMDGGHQWCEHDVRLVTPHLFNTENAARKIASRNGWTVKKWLYSRV